MVHALPGQMLGAEQIERVLPHGRIEGRNGEDVDLDPGIDEGPHVPLEESRDSSRVPTCKYGEFHAVTSLHKVGRLQPFARLVTRRVDGLASRARARAR